MTIADRKSAIDCLANFEMEFRSGLRARALRLGLAAPRFRRKGLPSITMRGNLLHVSRRVTVTTGTSSRTWFITLPIEIRADGSWRILRGFAA